MSAVEAERLAALDALRRRFEAQHPVPVIVPGVEPTPSERRRIARAERKRLEIDALFEEWSAWHRQTCELVPDPCPYVEIKAVFAG